MLKCQLSTQPLSAEKIKVPSELLSIKSHRSAVKTLHIIPYSPFSLPVRISCDSEYCWAKHTIMSGLTLETTCITESKLQFSSFIFPCPIILQQEETLNCKYSLVSIEFVFQNYKNDK